jgi:hypothetical protein
VRAAGAAGAAYEVAAEGAPPQLQSASMMVMRLLQAYQL